ncbi:MAG: hypothetical protein ACI915_001210 [Gammaproteobacteria bacterium]|jgi:hypothetical protein
MFGIYFGIILLLIGASLTTYSSFKSTNGLRYFAYLVSYVLFQMSFNGFGFQLLWSESTFLQAKLPTLFCGATLIFGINFCGRLFNRGRRSVHVDRALLLLACITGVAVLYHLLGTASYGPRVIICCAVATRFLVFIVALHANYLGDRTVRLFLFGWSFFLIGAIMTGGYILGFGPNFSGPRMPFK